MIMKYLFPLFSFFLLSYNLAAQTQRIPAEKDDIVITPILHATMVIQWNGLTIYMDPYGGAARFADLPAPDMVAITHVHGDHLNAATLDGLDLDNATLVAPQSVVDELGGILFRDTLLLKNGEKAEWHSIQMEAVPMYNLPETEDSRHPKGKGNGYVLTIGGKRIYISGDTEDILEMRQLKDIDVAFVCMNLPYTMDIKQAASAVLDFKPKVIYPFHYRGGGGKFSDVEEFKRMVNEKNENIEVRLIEWYPKQ